MLSILVPGTTWIKNEDAKIYKKTKLLSHIASKQDWARGHKLRHLVTRCIKDKYDVDLWEALIKDSRKRKNGLLSRITMFSITVMNADHHNYFTETLD